MIERHTQRFIISLGSNSQAEKYIPYALKELRKALTIDKESELMQTKPVDFPYPSEDFINVVLWGETTLDKEDIYQLLHKLEDHAGRQRSKPALVPLDADLLVWGNDVLKPCDLERPYMKQFFANPA